MAYRFTIIGGGLTATSMLCQLIDRLAAMGDSGRSLCQSLTIAVYEKDNHFGPGLPHSERNVLPLHITNMCAQEMSVRADKPGEFYHWLLENIERLEHLLADLFSSVSNSDQDKQCCHYPRQLMGEYLKSQFTEAVAVAKNLDISIELYPNREVRDLYPGDGCLYLTVANNADPPIKTKHHADTVLLATGHWFEKSHRESYYSSPWPAASLKNSIPQSADVAVIGSSLSAIETALTLSSDGQFLRKSSEELSFQPSGPPRKLNLYSRRGLLPRVRCRRGKRKNTYLTCKKISDLIKAHPSLIEIPMVLELFKQEITDAYSPLMDWQKILQPFNSAEQLLRYDITMVKNSDEHHDALIWQTILAEIVPMARELYLNLSPSARKCFDTDHSTIFFMHVATQPLENAEKLLALLEAGVAAVVSLGNEYLLEYDEKTRKFLIKYKDANGKKHTDSFTYVVNATGQPRAIHSDPSPLTQNLIKRFTPHSGQNSAMQPDSDNETLYESLKINPESHLMAMPETADNPLPDPPVFAVGPMVRNQIIDTSMALGLSKSTSQVADRLLTILAQQSDS